MVILKPGQQVTVGSYTVRYDGFKMIDDPSKQAMTAYTTVFANGKQVASLLSKQPSFCSANTAGEAWSTAWCCASRRSA